MINWFKIVFNTADILSRPLQNTGFSDDKLASFNFIFEHLYAWMWRESSELIYAILDLLWLIQKADQGSHLVT